jgi:hypothetical protein
MGWAGEKDVSRTWSFELPCKRSSIGTLTQFGPEKENEKLVSAMHSAVGFRHGAAAAGSLERKNEVDEAHNGSCVL